MLIAEYPPLGAKHLPVDPLRICVLTISVESVGQITLRRKLLFALLRLITPPQKPRKGEPRSHRPRELLSARLALTPHLVAPVWLLRHCILDEAADVHKAGFRAASAARLDRRRSRFETDDARSFAGRHYDPTLDAPRMIPI